MVRFVALSWVDHEQGVRGLGGVCVDRVDRVGVGSLPSMKCT